MNTYIYWEGLVPSAIQRCINSWGNTKVIRIDDKNYLNHIEPRFHEPLSRLRANLGSGAHGIAGIPFFTDALRLALLISNGGRWCDASLFLINDCLTSVEQDQVLLFQNPGEDRSISSWFIAVSQPRNRYLELWFAELMKKIDSGFIACYPEHSRFVRFLTVIKKYHWLHRAPILGLHSRGHYFQLHYTWDYLRRRGYIEPSIVISGSFDAKVAHKISWSNSEVFQSPQGYTELSQYRLGPVQKMDWKSDNIHEKLDFLEWYMSNFKNELEE
jgi:hypothetical protein